MRAPFGVGLEMFRVRLCLCGRGCGVGWWLLMCRGQRTASPDRDALQVGGFSVALVVFLFSTIHVHFMCNKYWYKRKRAITCNESMRAVLFRFEVRERCCFMSMLEHKVLYGDLEMFVGWINIGIYSILMDRWYFDRNANALACVFGKWRRKNFDQ